MSEYVMNYKFEGYDELRAKYHHIADKMDELSAEMRTRLNELENLIDEAERQEVHLTTKVEEVEKSETSGSNEDIHLGQSQP